MTTIDALKAEAARVLDTLNDPTKKIALWGAGPNSAGIVDTLRRIGDPNIIGIFDTRRTVEEEMFAGLPVLSIEDVWKHLPDDLTLVVSPGLNELYGDIVPRELFYYTIIHRRSIEAAVFIADQADDIADNLSLFSDDLSKQTYADRLYDLVRGVMFDRALQASGSPYFNNDLIPALEGGWLYAGLFNGKHFDRAAKLAQIDAIQLHGVEPSKRMFAFLKDKFKTAPNIALTNAVLWSKSGEAIKFNDDAVHGGLAASVSLPDEFGDTYDVKTAAIDDLPLADDVNSLSLDVEGSEQQALAGAEGAMSERFGAVSACIYHTFDDYIQVPRMLQKSHGGRLYVRQHSCIPLIETVCYSIR
ncbi:MAG: FkbM family methyltransferase [Pseudomonadota bacterium]